MNGMKPKERQLFALLLVERTRVEDSEQERARKRRIAFADHLGGPADGE